MPCPVSTESYAKVYKIARLTPLPAPSHFHGNGLNKNYINYAATLNCTATAINLFSRLASSFKFKKGSEASKNGDAAAAAASSGSAEPPPPPPPMSRLLLPSEETIAGMNSTVAVAVGSSNDPSNCGGE